MPMGPHGFNEQLTIPNNEKTPTTADQTEGGQMFETLKSKVPKPEQRQDYESNWIRPGTWVLVDQRVTFRKEGRLAMAKGRWLNHQIKAALKADHIERTRRTGEAHHGVPHVWQRQGGVEDTSRMVS